MRFAKSVVGFAAVYRYMVVRIRYPMRQHFSAFTALDQPGEETELSIFPGTLAAFQRLLHDLKAIPHKERTAKRLGKRYNKEVKKQLTMSLISDELGQASTKKKEFLGIMEKLIPWSEWVGIVQPHYYKGERGNKPYDLELMLRIYVLQHLYNLADDAARNEIIDSRAFSQLDHRG